MVGEERGREGGRGEVGGGGRRLGRRLGRGEEERAFTHCGGSSGPSV